MNALPLLLGGAALFLLMGKKEPKKSTEASAQEEETEETEGISEEIADEGTEGSATPEYGKIVARGKRMDKRGAHGWSIRFEEEGYYPQLHTAADRFAPVAQELGVTASMSAAKQLLRDTYNQGLLDAGYSESDFQEDPVRQLVNKPFAARG